MKQKNFALLLTLIVIVCYILLIFPKINYSQVPTKWSVGIDWGRYAIVNEGYIYQDDGKALTWQSDLKKYGSLDVLPKIYFATINIITGFDTFPNDLKFHYLFPFAGVILLPIILMLFYSFLCKRESKAFNQVDFCLLYLFCIFPTFSSIEPISGNTNGSGLARALFILILILIVIIFDEKKTNPMRVLLLVILFISFFYYYHTWSYYLALYLCGLLFFNRRKKDHRFLMSLYVLGIIIFFSYSIYYNSQLFDEPSRIISNFPQVIKNFPSVSYSAKVDPEYVGYLSLNSAFSYIQLLSLLFILIPCVIYFIRFLVLYKMDSYKLYEIQLFYYLLTQSIIGLGLFIWNGITGVISRIFESLVYISMLLISSLLVTSDDKLKSILRFIMLSAVFLTIISIIICPKELNWQLTNEEYVGIEFAGNHIDGDKYIFSDFRLGTPLIYFNQRGIVTLDSTNNLPKTTEDILDFCYYNVSNPEYILDSYIQSKDYFFLSSARQENVFLMDSSLKRFRVASKDFQEQWDMQGSFNNIYSSEQIEIFLRN
jgi:hypothetical protein